MSQEIVYDYPPIYDELVKAFPIRGKSIIFSWGDRLYVPNGETVTPELLAHEAAHGERQLGDIEGWWRRYIDDAGFRLQEELVAHRAEYAYLLRHGNRRDRRIALKRTAKRLAAPIYRYGSLCSDNQARAWLRAPLAYGDPGGGTEAVA